MQKRMIPVLAAALMVAGLFQSAPAASMAPLRGTLHGIVTDPSGAVVPGASVVVSNYHFTESVSTNETGQFAVSGLLPGRYRIQVRAAGFSTFTRAGFVIAAGKQTEANAQLVIRLPKQDVTVSD
jgi:Carboxypeptidase regulatory-like domain